MASPRLIALVLHGAGRYYLDPLFQAGRLPALQALAAAGHQRYFLTERPLAAGAWVTILTGQSVGQHGVIDYIDRDARAYTGLAGTYASSATYCDRSVQTVLSHAGLRVASVYLPMTSPPWPINGEMISGFPLLDECHPPTSPPELAARLPAFAPDRLFSLKYDDIDGVHRYLASNLEAIERVTRDACRAGHDVVLSCIPTPDLAHHYFWRRGDAAATERIYDWYARVDAAMARIWSDAGPDTTVVVFSDHGGRDAPPRLFGVNRWLADEGFLSPSTYASRPRVIGLLNRTVNWAKRHRLNHVLAGHIRGVFRRRLSALTHNTAFVDWARTRVYGLDFICPLVGFEVNLVGRQAQGIVPAAEYEPLRDELIRRAAALIDPVTGAPIFVRVARRENWFHGAHLDRFPDVIGELADTYDAKAQLDLPVAGPNPGQDDYPFLGYHGGDAYFCARGPGIPAGSTTDEMVRMIDLAPTLLTLAGVSAPAWMEGTPFRW